jgi:WD40-like Beta Propeller Repeat
MIPRNRITQRRERFRSVVKACEHGVPLGRGEADLVLRGEAAYSGDSGYRKSDVEPEQQREDHQEDQLPVRPRFVCLGTTVRLARVQHAVSINDLCLTRGDRQFTPCATRGVSASAHWLPNGRELSIGPLEDGGRVAIVRLADGSIARMQPAGGSPAWAELSRARDGALAWVTLSGRISLSEPGRARRLLPASIVGKSVTGDLRVVADEGLDWSPDGQWLAYFVAEGEGADTVTSDLGIVHRSGGPASRLPGGGSHPSWAPDGRRIVLERDGLTIVDARSGATYRPVRGQAYRPDWSSRGDAIVFDDNVHTIYFVRPDGSGRRRLGAAAAPGREAYGAEWSPDGSLIAYTSSNGAGCFTIGIVKADGTGGRFLVPKRG